MALEAGDAVENTGLAGAIATARAEAYGKKYSVKDDAKGINAEAAAIVAYITANAEVSITELPAGTPIDPPGVGTVS